VRQRGLEWRRDRISDETTVTHRAHELAHYVERGQIGDQQDGEAAHCTQHVILQVRRGPLLEAEANAYRRLELNGWSELDRTVRRAEVR